MADGEHARRLPGAGGRAGAGSRRSLRSAVRHPCRPGHRRSDGGRRVGISPRTPQADGHASRRAHAGPPASARRPAHRSRDGSPPGPHRASRGAARSDRPRECPRSRPDLHHRRPDRLGRRRPRLLAPRAAAPAGAPRRLHHARQPRPLCGCRPRRGRGARGHPVAGSARRDGHARDRRRAAAPDGSRGPPHPRGRRDTPGATRGCARRRGLRSPRPPARRVRDRRGSRRAADARRPHARRPDRRPGHPLPEPRARDDDALRLGNVRRRRLPPAREPRPGYQRAAPAHRRAARDHGRDTARPPRRCRRLTPAAGRGAETVARTTYARRVASASERIVVNAAGREIVVSNPGKVYFPEARITKLDVVRYYLAVADGALRGAGGRPNVLVRYANGIHGDFFYQKRAPTARPSWIEVVALRFPSGRAAEEVVPRDAAALAWMANLGCLELRPHPVRPEDLEHPDELRIDLDPVLGIGWPQLQDVARVVREVLGAFDLVGWPKTSGSRGIHVNVRIHPRWSFAEVRRAALALAREVERRAPELATSKWWKEERHGVFLDYNQNAKDRTVASAYSVRPTPDARVSAPVTWDELDQCRPEEFTLRSMPGRFAALGDRHADIDAHPCSLESRLELAARQEAEGRGGGHGAAPQPTA